MKAQLILENGKRFTGSVFGAACDVVGEVVFTTGMDGYQETITDPALAGQILTMTFPLVGNAGINLEDMEAEKASLKALVVREKCDYPSNFRNEMTLDDFLKQQGVVGLEGIDTRALTRILRNHGTMKGLIVVGEISDEEAMKRINALDNSNVIMETTTKKSYTRNKKGTHNVAYIDLGTKDGILRKLEERDCKITVFPADAKAEEILKINPDLVFVSSGPGDPNDAPETIETLKELIGKKPICGICTGHLVIGLALGAKTEKMKFGHHGGNQPVREIATDKVYITSQGHNYILKDLPQDVIETFINVNDGTCEGIFCEAKKIMSVQFHPEAAPGPQETQFIFDRFLEIIER